MSIPRPEAAVALSRAADEMSDLYGVVVQLVAEACAKHYGVRRSALFSTTLDRRGGAAKQIDRARACALSLLVVGRGWTVTEASAAFRVKRSRASKTISRLADARDEDPALDDFLSELEQVLLRQDRAA